MATEPRERRFAASHARLHVTEIKNGDERMHRPSARWKCRAARVDTSVTAECTGTAPGVCANGYSHDGGTDPTCYLGFYFGSTSTCVPANCAPLAAPFTTSDCGSGSIGATCTVQCAPGAHRTDGGSGTSVALTCSGTGPGTSEWTYPTSFTCAPDP